MRRLASVLMVFVLFILESTIFKSFSFNGIVPNLLIILTASSGFMQGKKTGLFVGLISGALLDIFFGDIVGLYTLIYMYIGFFNGFFHSIFFPEDIKLPLIMISLSDIFYNAMIYCLLFLLRGRFDISFYALNIVLPEIIYTMLITVPIYPLILLIYKKCNDFDRKRAQKFVGTF